MAAASVPSASAADTMPSDAPELKSAPASAACARDIHLTMLRLGCAHTTNLGKRRFTHLSTAPYADDLVARDGFRASATAAAAAAAAALGSLHVASASHARQLLKAVIMPTCWATTQPHLRQRTCTVMGVCFGR